MRTTEGVGQRGDTMRVSKEGMSVGVLVVAVALWVFVAITYIGNVVKLTQCDWDNAGSWKGEIVHAIGLVPPCAVVTVWNKDK